MDFLWMLEGIRTPFLDKLMQLITYFGQEMVIIVVICLIYWCIDKRFAYQLGFIYFTAGLVVQTLKITFRIPRPWVLDSTFPPVQSAVAGATGYSFPSGHTQGAVCLFLPLALKCKKIWGKVFCTFTFLLIGFSRMYLGCHTPKDVLTSLVISIFFTWLVWHFQSTLLDETSHIRLISGILTFCSLAVACYALLLLKNGIIPEKYAADCCKAAGAGLGFAVGWYLERTKIRFNPKSGNLLFQILKFVAGLLLALALKKGISFILGTSIIAKMIEYFILVLWVLAIYPAIFQKIKKQ